MDKRNIVFTVTTDISYDQRMQRICTTLAKEGHNVLLVGRKQKNSPKLKDEIYAQKRLHCLFNKSALFYAEYNIRLFFYLLFKVKDILCSCDLDTLLAGYLITKINGKTLVFDAHELFTLMPEVLANPTSLKVWTSIEKSIIPKVKYAYTESAAYKKVYESRYPTKFIVIRNVPFFADVHYNVEDRAVVIYQGRMNIGRGLEQLIEANKDGAYEVWLAGEGEVKPALERLIIEYNLQENVKLLGMINPADLRQMLPKAKIGINLLDPTNTHYRLSFPNKLFDYMMAELPQVTMNFENYKELVNNKAIGVYINQLDANKIRAALDRLFTDTAFYQECVANCKQLKQIHNWEREEEKLLSFYNAIP